VIEPRHGARGGDGPSGTDGERFLGELISHLQDLHGASVGGLVELRGNGQDVVGVLSMFNNGAATNPGLEYLWGRHAKPPESPEALRALAIDVVALAHQHHVNAPVSVARIRNGQGTDVLSQEMF